MNFELKGTLIVKNDTQEISERFRKREFVIEKKETSPNGFEFVDTIKFQLTQDRCSLIDNINVGQDVNVSFNIRGNKWEKDGNTSYFVNLDAWRIDLAQEMPASGNNASMPAEIPPQEDTDGQDDDLPF